MTEINIAYTLFEDEFNMMLVSMQSILANNPKAKINFYILSNDFFHFENNISMDLFLKQNDCNVIPVKCDVSKFFKIKNVVGFNPHFYSFDIANLINVDRILYLDANTIVLKDLTNLFEMDMKGKAVACPEYLFPQYFAVKHGYKIKYSANNAVMLIDTKKWKEYNLTEKLLNETYENYLDFDKLSHTSCFDIVVKDALILDFSYCYMEIHKNSYYGFPLTCSEQTKETYKKLKSHIDLPNIIMYVKNEPFNKYSHHSYKNLWWEYAEKSPIYQEIKDFRESNQYKLSATSASNSFDYVWLLSRMFPYIKPYLSRIILGFIISIPLGLLDGVTALALKPYMDYVIGGKAFEFTLFNQTFTITSILMAFLIPTAIILFAAIQGVLRYLNTYISSWTSIHITNDVKVDLFHHLIHMHPQFFDDNPSGIVISRYVTDPQTASSGIVDQIKTITTSIFGALGLIAVMIYSSWQLAFIGVLVLFMAFIPVTLLRKRMRMASNQNMVITGDITTNMNETYNGNKVMYAYDLQDVRENTFRQQTKDYFDINISLTKRTAWMSPMMYMIASVGIAVVLGVGTYLINTNQMTAGAFASFVTSLLLLYKPVKTLGTTLTGIQKIFVAMGRVFELFDLQPQIKDKENALEFKILNDNITFEDVCFEYVPNKPVIKNINLTVAKNETIAIVGNSGGGKSTLVNLINRFYEVKSGAVKYDGVDIREFSLKSLRGSISMVFQDNFLYSGTIKDNILMGKPDATVEELEKAIEYAHLEEMIEKLPEGLETVIGERGLTLSGGQRQRVAIARAMLRNAPIVILDEATSALDNESEAIVQQAMDNLMQNRTVFIIAHRLSTIKNADRIAVINEGKLVELGTHDDLMQIEEGQYKHLYEMQFKNQELKA